MDRERIDRILKVFMIYFVLTFVSKFFIYKFLFEVNLYGTINVIQYSLPHLLANTPDENNQKGLIINTASIAAFDGQAGQVLCFLFEFLNSFRVCMLQQRVPLYR
jgi:NAD(P)-dependent dehydrogenase (short-subunit alcohol dehydrogenase family)